ncbi:MXAN_6640 family putative metalloprotease [Nocardioides sp. W7]|uniref:MXAN_6640 family putative metalloprotease n=1 Tax=Nocardioides sp. W7 TaxID=2931390 RepID=UPI001FD18D21|nr:MXAN_6640 family putative metalloprotease [Nocardioides sp. W7]
MRRTIAAAVVAMATAFTVLPAQSASAADEVTVPTEAVPQIATDKQADRALAAVTELVEGGPAPQSTPEPGVESAPETSLESVPETDAEPPAAEEAPDLTLAMRDLYLALPRLSGAEREHAEALLARPTDGAADRQGNGYAVPAKKKCGTAICVHYVTSTADAPPSKGWVNYTLRQMTKVWKHEVKRMGYRKPLSDRALGRSRNGGNSKFDVYLKDLGSRGLYGYCAAEAGLRGKKYQGRAISYCVLDNDFARAQFGTAPKPTLKATAAHEFFHAVQFSYDYTEDPWFMESTATWMEERVFDSVNDNRQYLNSSQVRAPWVPLDTFSRSASFQYGNWAFWEYLSSRYGTKIVRNVWSGAAPRGKRNTFAIAALKQQLRRRGGFAKVYRSYAAANAFPARAYREGRRWPAPTLSGSLRLSKSKRTQAGTLTLNHLAAQHVRVRPAKSLRGKSWKLRIKVDGPSRKTSPAVVVTVQLRSGKLVRKSIRLNRKGKGQIKVSFSGRKVRSVTATAVNASTRFDCYRPDAPADPRFSCAGIARDDQQVFALKFGVVKR